MLRLNPVRDIGKICSRCGSIELNGNDTLTEIQTSHLDQQQKQKKNKQNETK